MKAVSCQFFSFTPSEFPQCGQTAAVRSISRPQFGHVTIASAGNRSRLRLASQTSRMTQRTAITGAMQRQPKTRVRDGPAYSMREEREKGS